MCRDCSLHRRTTTCKASCKAEAPFQLINLLAIGVQTILLLDCSPRGVEQPPLPDLVTASCEADAIHYLSSVTCQLESHPEGFVFKFRPSCCWTWTSL